MTTGEVSPPGMGPVLLRGPGERPEELACVLIALARLDAERRGREAWVPSGPHLMVDLEELLGSFPDWGWLLLDPDRVPAEDIGFLRRFLERRPRWQLLVLGADERDPGARALISLPRAQWVPWPPDLEELRALLPPPPASERVPRPPEPASLPAAGLPPLDVGRLLEERLTAAALQSRGKARYLFSSERDLPLARPREPLATTLDRILAVARTVAGERTVISAQAVPHPGLPGAPDAVQVRLDFPLSGVSAEALARSLGTEPEQRSPAVLHEAFLAARRTAELGARLEAHFERPGRAVLCLLLASQPLPTPGSFQQPPGPSAAAADGLREPRPEDPFA